MSHPIRDPSVQADIERKAKSVEGSVSLARLFVEFVYSSGAWKVGNISVTWPGKKS